MNGDQKLDVYDQNKQSFIQHFSKIIRVLAEDAMGHPEIGDAIARLKEVLEYVNGGKYQWGMTMLTTFQDLVELRRLDADGLQQAMTVGWCVELLQAFFLVSDDINGFIPHRGGQICWHQKPGIDWKPSVVLRFWKHVSTGCRSSSAGRSPVL